MQFTLEYALFVFVSAVGVLQFVFARNGIQGMLFIRRSPGASALLGVLLVAAAVVWFFVSGPRNLPDTSLGLDGNQQALWFALAAATAVGVTALLSSVINYRWAERDTEEAAGLDALEHTTFLQALGRRLLRVWEVRWTRR